MMDAPMRSGIGWIDALFDLCVAILVWLAQLFGVSYNEINIWIFCVIWPIFTVLLIALVVWQRIRIRRLTEQFRNTALHQTAASHR